MDGGGGQEEGEKGVNGESETKRKWVSSGKKKKTGWFNGVFLMSCDCEKGHIRNPFRVFLLNCIVQPLFLAFLAFFNDGRCSFFRHSGF